MTNDNTEQDEYEASEDLLYSITYGVRKFHLAGSWGNTILGVILEETEDSFLIAMPAMLAKEDNSYYILPIEEVCEEAYVRFLKTEFRAMSFAESELENMYTEYLRLNADDIFPELLDMINAGDDEECTCGNCGMPSEEEKEETEIKSDDSLKDAVLINGKGVTEEILKIKVEKAIKEGVFIPGSGKLAPSL